MIIDISQYFKALGAGEWLENAVKSLKLNSASELEERLNQFSCEGLQLNTEYLASEYEIQLKSFPTQRSLSRVTKNIDLKELDEGIDFFITSSTSKGENIFNIISSGEQIGTKSSFVNVYELYHEFDGDESKLIHFLEKNKSEKIFISSSHIHNAGGSIVQELNFILGLLKWCQVELKNKRPLVIEVATDSLYFNNIAKFRALRFLLESLQEQCEVPAFEILSVGSVREQTLYDPWVNMLRGLTQYSASLLGGAGIIAVESYDKVLCDHEEKKQSQLGLRQSRNAFYVLVEESHLGLIKDPAKGSYVIEDLTFQYIEKSFEKFKELESVGGVLKNLNKLSIEVEKISKLRRERVSNIDYTLTGINNYPNTLDEITKLVPLEKGLFPARRNSHGFEQIRLKFSEITLKPLVLFFGEEALLTNRIMFSSNFLELTGHACEIKRFSSQESYDDFNLIVLCSLDSGYEKEIKDFHGSDKTQVLIAGNHFKKEGYLNIFQGQNVLNTLTHIFKETQK